MHEISICQQLIKQVDDVALQNQASRVTGIQLQIGPLSGVDISLLRNAFPFAAENTIAEHAELMIEKMPVVIQCDQCGLKTHTQVNKLVCGYCGNQKTHLISGDEMLLVSVQLSQTQMPNDNNLTELNHV